MKTIASAFGNRIVSVFNNPTSLEEYRCVNQDHPTRMEKETKIAEAFVDFIRKKIDHVSKTSVEARICLLAHGHGAQITKKALELLKPEERNELDIYTFGGFVMIPKNLGNVVENYVYRRDMIARGGNKRYDPEGVLERMLKVTQRQSAEYANLENVLFTQFLEEWYEELDGSSHASNPKDSEEREERERNSQTFASTFWSKNPELIQGFKERYEKYTAWIKEYEINVLSYKNYFSDYEEDVLKKDNLLEALKDKVASYGEEMDNRYNRMSAFKAIFTQIANSFKPKLQEYIK